MSGILISIYVITVADVGLEVEFVFVGGGELFVGFDAADEPGLFEGLANGDFWCCRQLGFEGADEVNDLLGFVRR